MFPKADPWRPYLEDATVVQRARDTLTCVVDRRGAVRVSFFGGLSLNRVQSPETAEGAGILVASLRDLGGTKAQVVQSRAAATLDPGSIPRYEPHQGLAPPGPPQ